MRILHTPLNIANDAWSMSRAERTLGHDSTLAVIQQNPFADDADIDLGFPHLNPIVRPVVRRLRKTGFALAAPWRYDLCVYEFGTSIIDYHRPGLDLVDMRLARRSPTTVAAVFHGCDVRAAAGVCSFCPTCDSSGAARRLQIVRACADLVYVKTPDLLEVVPEAALLPQAILSPENIAYEPPTDRGTLRVVHGPSAPLIKGTSYVVDAVARLRAEGVDIELTLVQGMPHSEALELYRSADVAVDQLLLGWYGVFALELMAMGKPVVCFIDDVARARSQAGDLPIIDATPESLADVLRGLAGQRASLVSRGLESRAFVQRHHSAENLAARLIGDAEHVRSGDHS